MNRKRLLMVLFFLLTTAISLPSQNAAQHSHREQSSFGTEEEPGEPAVTQPLPVPDAVMQTMKLDDNVKGCLSYHPLSPSQLLNSWFIASEIHLGGPKEIDLVIIPIPRAHEPDYGCFHSVEGVGWFWVYRKIGERYQMVLKAPGNGLEILKARTNGYRNIQTGSFIAMSLATVTYCFDGRSYRECRTRPRRRPD